MPQGRTPEEALGIQTKNPLANKSIGGRTPEDALQIDLSKKSPYDVAAGQYFKFKTQQAPYEKAISYGLSALPVAAGLAGELTGGPIGGAALSGIGSIIAEKGREQLNDEFTSPIESLAGGDQAVMAAINAALYGTAGPISKVGGLFTSGGRKAFVGQTLNKLLSKQANKEDVEVAFNLFSDRAAPSVGQATGSTMAKFAESTVAKGSKLQREAVQQAEIPGILDRERSKILTVPKQSTETLGTVAQPRLIEYKDSLKAAENLAFNEFRKNAPVHEFNIITGYTQPTKTGLVDKFGKEIITPPQPIAELKSVEAPVLLFKSQSFAQRIKPSIDSMFSGEAWERATPEMQGSMIRIKQAVDEMARGVSVLKEDGTVTNLPLKEWSTIKEFRSLVNDKYAREAFKNLEEGGLTHLANLAGRDIENSAVSWDKSDAIVGLAGGHAERLTKANQSTKILHTIFNDEVLKNSMFKKGDVFDLQDPSQIFKMAYHSPESIRRLLTALPEDSRELMRADYFDNVLMKGFWNEATRTYNPDKVINKLADINSVSRELFNDKERRSWIEVMRAIRSVAPSETNNKAFWFRGAQFGLSFAGATAASLLSGGVRTGAFVGGAGLITMKISNDAVKKLFFDPQVARMAAGLAKMPAGSAGSTFAQKMILRSLRGTQVVLNMPDGESETGTVDENGKIRINQ